MNLEEIAAKFDQDGYILLPQVISKAELALLQEDTAHRMGEGYTPGTGLLRPGVPVPESWIHDRLRLMIHAIHLRKETSYGRDEAPFTYQPPAGYDVAWPKPDETLNYRPALGLNKYY